MCMCAGLQYPLTTSFHRLEYEHDKASGLRLRKDVISTRTAEMMCLDVDATIRGSTDSGETKEERRGEEMSSVCFRPSLVPSRSLTQAAPSNKRWQLKDKPQPHPTLAATYLPTLAGLSCNIVM
jgi:hypothetical protein